MTLNQARALLTVYYSALELFAEISPEVPAKLAVAGRRKVSQGSPTEARALLFVRFWERWGSVQRALERLSERQRKWLWTRYHACFRFLDARREMGLSRYVAWRLDLEALKCFIVALGQQVTE